jgi:hypothetical protein
VVVSVHQARADSNSSEFRGLGRGDRWNKRASALFTTNAFTTQLCNSRTRLLLTHSCSLTCVPVSAGDAASGRTRGAPARGSATSTARRDTREAQPHRRMMRSVICWAIGAGATGAAGDDGMASAGRLKGRLRSQTFALVTCTVCFRLQQQQPRHEWKMSAMYECEFTSSTQWWC